MIRKTFAWLVRRGVFDNTWVVAGVLLVVVALLSILPVYLGYPGLLPPFGLLSLALASFFAWRSAAHYAGSRLAEGFIYVTVFALVLLVKESLVLAHGWGLWPYHLFRPWDAHLGNATTILLFLTSLVLLADTDIRDLSRVEKALLGLGLAATYMLVTTVALTYQETPSNADIIQVIGRALAPALALVCLTPTLFTFWRTRFAPAWVTFALAMAGLLGAVVWGYSFYLPYLLLGVALFLHDLAYTRVALLRDQPESALGLSNERRLVRAFTWTADAVYRQLREIMGARQARLLAGRLNNYTLATGWRVFFVKDRMDGALPEDLSLIEQGKGYATILTLLLNLVAEAMGEKLTVRVLQRAYDSLPWEEREVGAQYLFPHVARAEALSRAFQDTRQNYRGLLRQMPLFSAMDDAEINLLCARLQAREYEPGQAIVRQGEAGEHFYIVAWGAVEVEMRDARGVAAVTGQLDRGDCFGEAALLQDTRHTATYRAAMPTSVLALSREDFERLVKARVIEREKVGRSVAWADLLRQMPLFAELDGRQIGRIAAQVQAATFAPGALLIRQGEVGDAFYVIESGRAQVSVEREGEMRAVAELGPGEYVGEIALLLQVPRTATVQALTPLNTLVLRKNDFDRLVASHLYVSQGLERESSRRMMDLR